MMKRIFIITAFMLMIPFYGCTPEEEIQSDPTELNQDQNNETEDENKVEDARYYAKYEVYMPLGYKNQGILKTISFTNEYGIGGVNTAKDYWEGIYGPFDYGTKLFLKAEGKSGILTNVEYYVRLSVSKNNEQFVIKGESRNIGVSMLQTSYTINF